MQRDATSKNINIILNQRMFIVNDSSRSLLQAKLSMPPIERSVRRPKRAAILTLQVTNHSGATSNNLICKKCKSSPRSYAFFASWLPSQSRKAIHLQWINDHVSFCRYVHASWDYQCAGNSQEPYGAVGVSWTSCTDTYVGNFLSSVAIGNHIQMRKRHTQVMYHYVLYRAPGR